jgi:hypothetical protein
MRLLRRWAVAGLVAEVMLRVALRSGRVRRIMRQRREALAARSYAEGGWIPPSGAQRVVPSGAPRRDAILHAHGIAAVAFERWCSPCPTSDAEADALNRVVARMC